MMNWYPNTGVVPAVGLLWPQGIATTSLTLMALGVCLQLALLALRAVREPARPVPVPCPSAEPIDDEVTKTAA